METSPKVIYIMAKSEDKGSKRKRKEEGATDVKKHKKNKSSASEKTNGKVEFLAADNTTFDPTISSLFANSVCPSTQE